MKLEIGNFPVKDVVFGDKTGYQDGILTVNREEAIQALNPDGNLTNVELHIVHPGERARILPIKEIVEPRARPDGRAVFPGHTGAIDQAGEGQVFALKGMACTAVGKFASLNDGMLDMSGPAAEVATPYAHIIHLCFTAQNADPAEEIVSAYKKNLWHRLGAHLLAQYLGKAVLGQTPESWDVYSTDEPVSPDLPRVAIVQQLSTAWVKEEGFDTILYGADCLHLYPTFLHPNEFLDGAVCGDTLQFPSFKQFTYCYQNHPMIRELYKEHGKTVNFVCVFLDVNPAIADRKIRASNQIVKMAKMMGIEAAIVMNLGNGHSEIDFFTTIAKLKEAGIKCVGHCHESPGHGGGTQPKIVMDARADAIVSCGTDHRVMELPAMDRIVGELESIGRDEYTGAWAYDPEYGPSRHEDGSLTIDSTMICGHNGNAGWSFKTTKSY